MPDQEKMTKAYEWLDKAIRNEAANNGTLNSMGEKMLEQACKLEREANAA